MEDICIIGAAGDADAETLKHELQKIGVLGVDSQMVCGREHLLAAALSAKKAFDERKNVCSTLPMEIMLYASGERQITKAAAKMGIKDCQKVALVIFDKDMNSVITQLNMLQDDDLLNPSEEKMKRYGISDDELKSVPSEKRYDLILERVAFATLRNK